MARHGVISARFLKVDSIQLILRPGSVVKLWMICEMIGLTPLFKHDVENVCGLSIVFAGWMDRRGQLAEFTWSKAPVERRR